MQGLPVLSYDEVNQSVVPPATLVGAHGVITPTLFGQADKPYEVASVSDLTTLFGGPGAASPYFAQLRRAVALGTTFWIQRLLATGATAAALVLATPKVTITAKDFGSWANGTLGITYVPAAAPAPATLNVSYSPDSTINETFSADTFVDLIALVNSTSQRILITTQVGFTEPAAIAVPSYLATGVDGTFATGITQDAAIEALYPNFNNLTNLSTVFQLGSYTSTAISNLKAYVDLSAGGRGDVMGIFEIDPSLTPQAAQTFAATLVDYSSYLAGYYSSLILANSPEQSMSVNGPCLCDVASVFSVSDTISGNAYKAPAGSRRGLIANIQSFAYNMLAPAYSTIASALNMSGINIVGNDSAFGPVVWGAQTFAQSNSSLDAINVRRSLFAMRGLLTPIFRSEQFEPMDPVAWRDAYGKASAVLTSMVSARAIYAGWTYTGDQAASVISDAVYNDPTDLANGDYKVLINVVFVGYIRNIAVTLDINSISTLFAAGVSV